MRIGTDLGKFKNHPSTQSGDSAEEMFGSMAKQLIELDEAITEYAELAPDKGQALLHAVKVGRVLLQMQMGLSKGYADLRRVLDEVIPEVNRQLAARPPTLYMRRMQIMLARFDRNADRALSAVGDRPKVAELEEMQTQMRLALVLVHKRDIPAFAKQLADTPSFAARDALTGALAILAFGSQDNAKWLQIETLLQGLLVEAKDDATRLRLTNNLAVARFRRGEKGEAVELLIQGLQLGQEPSIANLNYLAIHEEAGPELLEALAQANPGTSECFAQPRLRSGQATLARASRREFSAI
jgi:hypothetical protein